MGGPRVDTGLEYLGLVFYHLCMARVQYLEVQCKSALNRVRGMPFKWSLNPYRGCAHACHYCYARASHTYYGLNAGEDFETKIFVKVNVADVLRRELARPSWPGEQVALGTITDCYQPAEGRFRVTRRVLEALLERRNPISMVTKSTLVLRDLDLLADLARVAHVRVYFSVTTMDPALWRTIEPGTPPPWKRLHVMRLLGEAGVPAGVLMAPILPGLTDSVAAIEAVVAAAAEHEAAFFGATALRLAPDVKEHYLDFVGAAFPDLLPRYQRAYPAANAPRDYQMALQTRVERIRARYGFTDDALQARYASMAPHSAATPPLTRPTQLALPL
jgi:DNA repair photolyase